MNPSRLHEKDAKDTQEWRASTLLHPKVTYAITINPDDKRQYFTAPPASYKQRLKEFKTRWRKAFVEFFDLYDTDYHLFLECSEPYRKGQDPRPPRLHFHGYIRFHDAEAVLQFLLVTTRALQTMANIIIDTIDPSTSWKYVDYCEKQQYLPYPIFSNIPPHEEDYIEWLSIPGMLKLLDSDSEEIIQ